MKPSIDSREVEILFHDLSDDADDLPLDQIGQLMVQSVRQNFQNDGRPDKWPERSNSTRSWNSRLTPQSAAFGIGRDASGRFTRSNKGDWPLLRKTGRMYASIDYTINSIPEGHEVIISDHTKYGKFHNTGTKKMPKRQFLLFQNEDVSHIENILSAFV